MRFLRWTVALIVAALVVDFAISNRGMAELSLWPFAEGLRIWLFLAILLPFLIGLALGWFAAGWRSWRRRRAEKKTAA
jgi:uncharacterized integral membrane protein